MHYLLSRNMHIGVHLWLILSKSRKEARIAQWGERCQVENIERGSVSPFQFKEIGFKSLFDLKSFCHKAWRSSGAIDSDQVREHKLGQIGGLPTWRQSRPKRWEPPSWLEAYESFLRNYSRQTARWNNSVELLSQSDWKESLLHFQRKYRWLTLRSATHCSSALTKPLFQEHL